RDRVSGAAASRRAAAVDVPRRARPHRPALARAPGPARRGGRGAGVARRRRPLARLGHLFRLRLRPAGGGGTGRAADALRIPPARALHPRLAARALRAAVSAPRLRSASRARGRRALGERPVSRRRDRLPAGTRRPGLPALRDLSLVVRDGEFLVLLGPSGCGKTTVLRCIAGLEDPTSGEILIGDRDVTQAAPADRDVAMVFQTYALYPHLTVRENIAFALEMRGVPRAEIQRRVGEAADRLGIGGLLERHPAELSGGERQRAALGRAIVREPRVFLFDEPLSNLDAKLRMQLRAELLGLHR